MGIQYRQHEMYPRQILIRDFMGIVDVNQIIDSWEYLKEKKMLTDETLGVINNLSGCKLEMNLESFKTLMSYLKEQCCINEIKLAVIADSPGKVVFPVLAEREKDGLNVKPFSTIDSAVDWILSLDA